MEKKVFRVEFEVEADSREDVIELFEDVVDSRKAMILNESFEDTAEDLKARIAYNKKEDSFELRISTDGGDSWGISVSCPCCCCVGQDPDEDEPMFVHVGIIQELKNAISYGYRIVY